MHGRAAIPHAPDLAGARGQRFRLIFERKRPDRPDLSDRHVASIHPGTPRGVGGMIRGSLAMSLKYRQAPPPSESPDALAAEIEALWPQARGVTAHVARKGNQLEEIGSWDVTHVEGIDPHLACLADLRDVFDRCRQHAEESGRAASYVITIIGLVPGKGRKPSQTEAELHRWRGRFGDQAELAGESATPVQGMTAFLRAVPGIYEGVAAMSERTLQIVARAQELQLQQIALLTTDNERLREERDKMSLGMVDMHKATLDFNLTMAREAREEKRDDENREAQRQAQQKQWEGIQQVVGVVLQFGQWVVSTRQGEQHAASAPPGTLRQDLQRLVAAITEAERAQIVDAIGDRMWDLLAAAGAAEDDQRAAAILQGLKAEAVAQGPKLAVGLQRVQDVLGVDRTTLFKSILLRAGFPMA